MNIGLIGLEKAGKTTIFNALTKSNAEVTNYSGKRLEPNVAVVDVEDERVTKLSAMYKPKKTIYAGVEFIDFAGLSSGAAQNGIFSAESMNLIKSCDALALVLRNFQNEILDETLGKADPLSDFESLNTEIVLSDLIIVERRLERIENDLKRGRKTAALQTEEKVLSKLKTALDEGTALRELELSKDEHKTISGFQFLSYKPMFVILNSGEDNYGKNQDLIDELGKQAACIEFAGNFEMELSRLEDEEAELFMSDMGIEESARSRLTSFAYQMLGYISFFTVGEDEVRAWTVRKGATAVEAADTVHSDIARGFIRAECFHYNDLMEAGSEKDVRAQGKFRLEGKEYQVKDGDILHFRFSI